MSSVTTAKGTGGSDPGELPRVSLAATLNSVQRALAAAIALGAAASIAWSATPPDLASDPLNRQAWIARQAVYRVSATVRVSALVGDGRVTRLGGGAAHDITILGTGFAVVEGGTLVTAAHVVQPTGRSIAIDLERARRSAEGGRPTEADLQTWADRHKVGVIGLRVLRRFATRIHEAGQPVPRPTPLKILRLRDQRTPAIDVFNDVAIVRIDAPGSAALTLAKIPRGGQQAAAVGFGAPSDGLSPTTKIGETGDEEREPGSSRRVIAIAAAVHKGDSGGPALDTNGNVLGMVSFAASDGRRLGALTPVQQIRDLLEGTGLANQPGPRSRHFARAMGRVWAFDLDAATSDLDRALRADPGNVSAAFERTRVDQLAQQGYRIAGTNQVEGALGALALASALASAAFAVAAFRRLPNG